MKTITLKRIFILFIFVAQSFFCLAQRLPTFDFSAIVLDQDSLPIFGATVVNPRTGNMVKTDKKGFFCAKIAEDDSLLVYHIAYRRRFLHLSDNCLRLQLIPENYRLNEVTVYEDSASIARKMDAIVQEIRTKALSKKLEGYDRTSRQDRFYFDNSVRAKASSPYFGPTANISFGQIAGLFKKLKRNKGVKDKPLEEPSLTP